MTREELKEEAKKLGLKVKEGFMDDLGENSIVLAVGVAIGIAVGKFLL